MGAVLLEAIRVGTSLFVLGLEQLAVVLEGPAMEGAGEGTLVATLLAAQGGATVGTGVDQAVQLTLLVTGDHHRLAAHGHGHEVARLGDLALMGQEQPVAFEDVLHLQFEEGRVGEHAAMAAEDALLGVVLDGATDALLELIKLAGHDPYPRYLVVWSGGPRGWPAVIKGWPADQTLAVPASWLAWSCSSSLARGRAWRCCSSGLSVLESSMSNTTSEKGPSSSRLAISP